MFNQITQASFQEKLIADCKFGMEKYACDWEPVSGDRFTEERRYLIFDGARGHSMGSAIQVIAQEYGWTGERVPFASEDYEAYSNASEEAEEYLGQLLDGTPYFMTHDDGFFLVETRNVEDDVHG